MPKFRVTVSRIEYQLADAAVERHAAEIAFYRAKLTRIQGILGELIRDGDRGNVTMEAHAAASVALSDGAKYAGAALERLRTLEETPSLLRECREFIRENTDDMETACCLAMPLLTRIDAILARLDAAGEGGKHD